MMLLLLSVLLSSLFIYSTFTNHDCRSSGSFVKSIDYLYENQSPDMSVVSNIWPYFGYSLNIPSNALYTEDLEMLYIRHHPSFIVYHDSAGNPFDLSLLDTWSNAEKVAEFSDSCDGTAHIYKIEDY